MSNGRLSNGSTGTPPLIGIQGHALSWTDDLPVCHLSGVGFSTNQIYREDGHRREEHEFEDSSFHFCLDNDCFFYGVFDGHDGSRVAHFAAQRMPAELLLGQLSGKTADEEIKEVLNQAFLAVENSYLESIDEFLAEKTTVHLQIPEGMSTYDAFRRNPEIEKKLQDLEAKISGGTTATVVLIKNNKLYEANVGDSRALLCTTEDNGILRVMQLSVDHTISNEDERIRLSQLGLDVEKLKKVRKLGSSDNTRCIGDYHVKGGFMDIDVLSCARSEPVIAEPYLFGGAAINSSCAFLIIMSDGLYKAYEDVFGNERVNSGIAGMVANEFSVQSTLNGVAQAVVDKVVRSHHDTFMTGSLEMKRICQKRDDITLLVRNFNYPLANAMSPTSNRFHPTSSFYHSSEVGPAVPTSSPQMYGSPTSATQGGYAMSSTSPQAYGIPNTSQQGHSVSPTGPSTSLHAVSSVTQSSTHTVTTFQLSIGSVSPNHQVHVSSSSSGGSDSSRSSSNTHAETPTNSLSSTQKTTNTGTYASTSSTQSSSDSQLFSQHYHGTNKLELDEQGKIEAYVDFTNFYQAIAELTDAQRESLNAEMKPKSSYETIAEEAESQNVTA